MRFDLLTGKRIQKVRVCGCVVKRARVRCHIDIGNANRKYQFGTSATRTRSRSQSTNDTIFPISFIIFIENMTTANRSFHRAQSKNRKSLMYEIRKFVCSKLEEEKNKRTNFGLPLPSLLLHIFFFAFDVFRNTNAWCVAYNNVYSAVSRVPWLVVK